MAFPKTDINAHITPRHGDSFSVVAGGGADGVAQVSDGLDRTDYQSASVCLLGEVTLGDAETATVLLQIEESDDGSAWDAPEEIYAAAVAATGGAGGSTEKVEVQAPLDLRARKQFIRAQATVTLSAGSADTGDFATVFVLGGKNILPA